MCDESDTLSTYASVCPQRTRSCSVGSHRGTSLPLFVRELDQRDIDAALAKIVA
jgi:hypothetical protein